MNILIHMPYNPGDVVMAMQASTLLSEWNPKAHLEFLTSDESLGLVQGCRQFKNVLGIPRQSMQNVRPKGDSLGLASLLNTWISGIEKKPYSHSFNFFQGRFGGIIQSFISAPQKTGLELKNGLYFELNNRALQHLWAIPAKRLDNPFHVIDLYRLAMCEAIQIPLPSNRPPPLLFDLPANPTRFAPRSYFAFHPGAAYPGKRWPKERWIQLAERCLEAGRPLVWTGSTEEQELVLAIINAIPARYQSLQQNFTGRTQLLEAGAIYANAERTVCGDTAAMHLSAAMNTPVLSLFGPSNPIETGPYGSNHLIIQTRQNLSSDLNMDAECPELSALEADAVAQLLLCDSSSSLFFRSIWKTTWDEASGIQILKDFRNKTHSSQRSPKKWIQLLQLPAGIENTEENIEPLFKALTCAIQTQTPESCQELERYEEAWAKSTPHDLIWEAYRIALNGLPLLPLQTHFQLRLKRLHQALLESRNVVSNSTMV